MRKNMLAIKQLNGLLDNLLPKLDKKHAGKRAAVKAGVSILTGGAAIYGAVIAATFIFGGPWTWLPLYSTLCGGAASATFTSVGVVTCGVTSFKTGRTCFKNLDGKKKIKSGTNSLPFLKKFDLE